jgi:hypothetical protein
MSPHARSLAFAASAIFATLCGLRAQATELLTNGGFETGDFSGWIVGGNPAGNGVVPDNTYLGTYFAGPNYSIVHSGTYTAEYVGNVYVIFALNQAITAEAGLLTLSGYIGSRDASYAGGYSGTETVLVDGTAIALSQAPGVPSDGTMALFSGTTTVTAGTHSIDFLFNFSQGAFGGFSIDDLSATQTPVPEPASLPLMLGSLATLGLIRRGRGSIPNPRA